MKLTQLLESKKVVATGFKAIEELASYSKGNDTVVLSSLSPAILAEQGITNYYAITLPRGTVFNTAEDIIQADPDVQQYKISIVDKLDYLPYANPIDTVIVSRHQGTIDILQSADLWSGAEVYESVTPADIKGKHVVGTLPPALIKDCDMYTAVTIRDFDYTRDGDLTGEELKNRLVIADNPIKVSLVESPITIDYDNKLFIIKEDIIDDILMHDAESSYKVQCPTTGDTFKISVDVSHQKNREQFGKNKIDISVNFYNGYLKLWTYKHMYKNMLRNKGTLEDILKDGSEVGYHGRYLSDDTDWRIKVV